MSRIEALYQLYSQDLYRYLLSLTHDRSLSEDLLSETFLRALKALPGFQEKSTVKTWLFGIARNVWLSDLRKRRPELRGTDELLEGVYPGPEAQAVTRQTAERVYALMEDLDERSRTVVQMRLEGYAYGVISQTLGISEGAARVLDFRAKKTIRETLRKEGLY